jgi:hypothetical protein
MVKLNETPEANEQPNKKPMPAWVQALLWAMVVLIVINLIVLVTSYNRTLPKNTEVTTFQPEAASTSYEPPEKTLIKVKASQLYKDFDDNEARAIKKYTDKRIQITGIVDRIDSTFNDKPVVYLKTPNLFSSVHIDLVESDWGKAENYNKGQQKTFICESVDEMIGSPMLKDCIDYGS